MLNLACHKRECHHSFHCSGGFWDLSAQDFATRVEGVARNTRERMRQGIEGMGIETSKDVVYLFKDKG